jgi:hypothetical protein
MRKPCAILALAALPFGAPLARADDHLVSRGAAGERLTDAASERARNLASVEQSLGSVRMRQTAAQAGVDIGQVRQALPLMSDSDLRDLSRRAAALDSDPVAGDDVHDDLRTLVFISVIGAMAIVLINAAED